MCIEFSVEAQRLLPFAAKNGRISIVVTSKRHRLGYSCSGLFAWVSYGSDHHLGCPSKYAHVYNPFLRKVGRLGTSSDMLPVSAVKGSRVQVLSTGDSLDLRNRSSKPRLGDDRSASRKAVGNASLRRRGKQVWAASQEYAKRRRERAQRDRRLEKLAIEVLTALGERDATIAASEQRAGAAL
jgi:hypothetical protein